MRPRILLVVVVATMAGWCPDACPDDRGPAKPKGESISFASRAIAISDVILRNHIDPPTRQQMILEGAKAVYRAAERPVPHGLSRRVSTLAATEEFSKFLEELRAELQGASQDLESALVNGVLQSVPGRPRLVAAAEFKVQGQLSANRYVGTGIVLNMNQQEKRPAIPKVFYNGPAWKAGVKGGDVIMEIDGHSTDGMTIQQVLQRLRGEKGSVVEVMVRQPDAAQHRTLKITRDVAFIPSVEGHRQLSEGKWQYRVDSAKELGYVRINRMGSSTLHELRQVEAQLRGEGLRGIVLDLRFGGGLLHDAVLVADSLLDGGPIGRVRSADGVRKYNANPGAMFKNLPMAVLIDRLPGGDRLFLTAALQDNRRVVVIGEQTTYHGFVNQGIPAPGGRETLILATGVLQRGDGTPLRPLPRQPPSAGKRRPGGVVPDHLVTMSTNRRAALMRAYSFTTPGLRKPVDDPVLAKAVEVLRKSQGQSDAKAAQRRSGHAHPG